MNGATKVDFFDRTIESTDSQIEGVMMQELGKHDDQRGWLVELYRNDELPGGNEPVMAYVSETKPGVCRGPHEHVDQSDYFAFIGPGNFKLYLWDMREDSPTYRTKQTAVLGEAHRCGVIIPPGVIHAYKCVSETNGWVFNGPNRLYAGEGKSQPVDEIRHEEIEDSPYILD
jgi:dTDP-4-dehydrorhamnose 3,5-epimerase